MVRAMPRRRSFRLAASLLPLLVIAAAVAIVPVPHGQPVADAAPAEKLITTPGPLGPITVIGDSVLLGSLLTSPTLADTLAARGWGPVRMRAGEGYSTGVFDVDPSFKVSNWIRTWRSQGWDPVDVVVNLGANDSGFCMSDTNCAYSAIMFLVDAIGPGHRIWWPKITRFYTHEAQQNAWNQALDRVDHERDDFWTWDWPFELAHGGYSSPDQTHLSADGYRKRSRVMAREITADLAFARHVGGDAPLAAVIGAPAEFVPLPPGRVLDTRDNGASRVAAGTNVDLDMTPYVPAGTTAVAVNLTSAESTAPGFLTGYPCDRPRQEVSNVNHGAGEARGALAVVPLSASGHLCVHTHAAGHVIVDLQGAFVPDSPDGVRFTPLATPTRLLDTRDTGRAPIVVVNVPAGAEAVAVNITATEVTSPGWLKAFPCGGSVPDVSNVNYLPGDTVASAAFVPVAADDTICVQSLNPVDVIVDLTGVFGVDGELRFVPTDPTRMLDTRTGTGGWMPYQGAGQVLDPRVVPAGAHAVTGTITLVGPLRPGWLKAYPCGTEPPTSTVNGGTETVFANAVTVGVDAGGRMCVKALSATNTLFDVTGWWVP
jgi:hypothetical protein